MKPPINATDSMRIADEYEQVIDVRRRLKRF
jgi:hypothetical protein